MRIQTSHRARNLVVSTLAAGVLLALAVSCADDPSIDASVPSATRRFVAAAETANLVGLVGAAAMEGEARMDQMTERPGMVRASVCELYRRGSTTLGAFDRELATLRKKLDEAREQAAYHATLIGGRDPSVTAVLRSWQRGISILSYHRSAIENGRTAPQHIVSDVIVSKAG